MPTTSKSRFAVGKPSTRWRLQPRLDTDLLTHLCGLRGLDPTLLEPDFANHLHDPQLLPDIAAARALIVRAKKEDWLVTIFGDYDADGTPAAALLSLVFDELAIRHRVIIPKREEGYGLNEALINKIADQTQLLITVDNGIAAVAEITLAKQKGLRVIVIDHHLPGSVLPPADALIDPFIAKSQYPFNHLCGCALAYKFTEALSVDFPEQLTTRFRKWLLDLVAISTVADMMKMIGENRVLVHYGLKVLEKNRRPGLQALLKQAGIEVDSLSASTLGFAIGPRLNAAGRLGDNQPVLNLLLSKTVAEAEQWAVQIEKANRERQTLVETVLREAGQSVLEQNSLDDRCLIVLGENWPAGILGLVAGKLAGRYHRPAVVLARVGNELRGSARSVGDYSIIDGLEASTDTLIRFGGHRQAAGLSLSDSQLAKFSTVLKNHARKQIPVDALQPSYTADCLLDEKEISQATWQLLEKLAPFGFDNPQPLLIIENVQLGSPKLMGKNGDHCKWSVTKGGQPFDVVGFGLAQEALAHPLERANLLGYLEVNRWRSQVSLQFRLVDYRPVDYPIETLTSQQA